jgi:hypothetical protein
VLAGQKEEQLVLQDRAANRKSIVLVTRFGSRAGEWVGVLEKLVVVVVVGRAVETVSARLDSQIRSAPRAMEREVFNRVDRQDHTGDRRNTALVDGRNIPPEIVVVGSLDLPVH